MRFRLGKQEAGLMDYEGRNYTGLMRHLTLALIVLGFVATHTERLRGEKPTGDGRAGVPGAEPAVRCDVPPAPAAFPKRGTPATSSATTRGEMLRPPSPTRSSGINLCSKPALYC